MTPADLAVLQAAGPGIARCRSVGLVHPEAALRAALPRAEVLTRAAHPFQRVTQRPFDLLVAANALMYAPEPLQAIDCLLDSTDLLLLLEPCRRQRSPHDELGDDGDRHRFTVDVHPAGTDPAVNLSDTGALLAHRFYEGTPNSYGPTYHVAALLAGRRLQPLLRVDDYPTGVRPIAADLNPLHDVLRTIDGAGVAFSLGIVPSLVTPPMAEFLRSLKHLRPAVHGWEHGYPRCSQLLIEKGDPNNQRGTVTGFDEFEGRSSPEIHDQLVHARRHLQALCGRPATTYIPPNNIAGRATGRVLAEVGFTQVLSEKRIAGCELPVFPSDFYGRSHEYTAAKRPRVVSLHATWEVDVRREAGAAPLPRLMADLAARTSSNRARQLGLISDFGL